MQRGEGKKQLLSIEPKSEILFKGPYDHVVTENFKIYNPSEHSIAFKVKTTAPKRYCVRPNNGLIVPLQTINVAVMLQPGDLSQEKHKHKFMIQSVVANSNDANIDELFKSVPSDEIMDSKFKCVFLDAPAGAASGNQIANQALQQKSVNQLNQALQKSNQIASSDSPSNGISSATSANEIVVDDGGGIGIINTRQKELINGNNNENDNEHCQYQEGRYSPSSVKMNDFVDDNMVDYEAAPLTQRQNDEENLRLLLSKANDEIQNLREKLRQVQQCYKKQLSSSSLNPTSTNQQQSLNDSSFLNQQKILQLSIVVVVLAFVFGIFFAKTVI